MPVTAGALVTSVCINGSIGLACFSLFAVLRQWRVTAKLYKPKRYIGAENVSGRKPAPLAAELPAGLLSWIKPVWCYKELDVIDLCGLDVAVFFRALQLGVRLFTFITVWCLLVVMPVNMMGGYLERHKKHKPLHAADLHTPGTSTSWMQLPALLLTSLANAASTASTDSLLSAGTGLDHTSILHGSSSSSMGGGGFSGSSHFAGSGGGFGGSSAEGLAPGLGGLGNFSDVIHTNLDLLTLSNVPPGSPKMWVHLASVYVITLVALKLLWDLSKDVSFKRAVFLAVQGRSGPGSSVVVSDLPGLEWGTPLNRLQLSWVRWLLPQGLFKRGFDQQLQQARAQQPQQQRRHYIIHPQQQQQQPLLTEDEKEEDPAAAAEEAAPLLPGAAPAGAPAGSSSSNGSSSAAGVVVEVTSAGAAAGTGGLGSSSVGDGSSSVGDGSSSGAARVDVGPPVVKDVWQEAVEVLQHNGGDVKAMVEQEMTRVYGGDSVAALVLVHDTTALDAAAASYCALQEQFEDVLDWYQCRLPPQQQQGGEAGDAEAQLQGPVQQGLVQQQGWMEQQGLVQQQQQSEGGGRKGSKSNKLKRKTVLVVGPRHGAWGVERFGVTPCQVDALEFYPAVLGQRLRELMALQREARSSLPRPAAVVTFRRQLVATLAAASLHSYDETSWTISPAPAPPEMLWEGLGLRAWEVAVRRLAVWSAFWWLVLFYAPVVALIQAPVNMDNLRKVPLLNTLLDLPLVSSLVQGFLPSLVLLTFLAVLPSLLSAIIRRAGLHSVTAADSVLIEMYFLFQMFAVFIFSFVSGTALSQLQALIDDPHRIVSLLGVSAPQQASFFSTYILLLGLSRMPLELLRLPQLGLYLLRRQLADSPRARKRLWANQQQMLGRTLPLHTLVLLLGLVFCVASPLIAPVTLLYFVSSSVCQRYQWLYVYKHPYEGAGTLWKQVFTQVMVAVYFFVAVMGCLLGIKRFEEALLLLPLAVGVLVFHVLAGRLLERPLTLPPSREAAAMDAYTAQHSQQQQQQQGSQDSAAAGLDAASKSAAEEAGLPNQAGAGVMGDTAQGDELSGLYLSPAMKLGPEGLQPLLEEAADCDRRLRALGY